MGRTAVVIDLTVAEWRELGSPARAHRTGRALARRARIVLAAAAGPENKAICAAAGADADTVTKWRRRFAAHRLDRLRVTSGHPTQDRRRRARGDQPTDAGDHAARCDSDACSFSTGAVFHLSGDLSTTGKNTGEMIFPRTPSGLSAGGCALRRPEVPVGRGVHRSTAAQLEGMNRAFVDAHNADPILATIQRLCHRT